MELGDNLLKEQQEISKEEYEKIMNESNNLICTCDKCLDNNICEYAFDDYCIDGDCLAVK